MKYAVNPRKAQIMLDLCHPGNNIYEVTKRFTDGSIGLSYAQAPTPEQAEAIALEWPWCKSAVARLIVKD